MEYNSYVTQGSAVLLTKMANTFKKSKEKGELCCLIPFSPDHIIELTVPYLQRRSEKIGQNNMSIRSYPKTIFNFNLATTAGNCMTITSKTRLPFKELGSLKKKVASIPSRVSIARPKPTEDLEQASKNTALINSQTRSPREIFLSLHQSDYTSLGSLCKDLRSLVLDDPRLLNCRCIM